MHPNPSPHANSRPATVSYDNPIKPNNMKRCIYSFVTILSFCTTALWAQQGIGTATPHSSAALEIASPDKGLLIPRISLTSSASLAPVTGTASDSHNGLLVYNTNTATNTGLSGVGYYFWEGGSSGHWHHLADGLPTQISDADKDTHIKAVDLDGTGTNSDTLEFTVAGSQRMVVDSDGKVGIGDTAPSEKLNVAGNIMLEGSDQYLYLTNTGTFNNGIYVRGNSSQSYLRNHSTGIFTWEVSGAEKMRIDSDGKVTIGSQNNTSSGTLTINNNSLTASPTIPLLFLKGDLDSSLEGNPSGAGAIGVARSPQATYAGQLRFLPQYYNGSAYVYSDTGLVVDPVGASGNVNTGINTSTPNQNLTVSGTLGLTGHFYDSAQSSGTTGQVLTRNANGTLWADGGGNSISDTDGDTHIKAVDLDGTGTNSDTLEFTLNGDKVLEIRNIPANGAYTWTHSNTFMTINRNGASGNRGYFQFYRNNQRIFDLYGTTDNSLFFDISANAGTEFVIEASGNVGIGDESPDQTLSVSGTAVVQGAEVSNARMILQSTTTANSPTGGPILQLRDSSSEVGISGGIVFSEGLNNNVTMGQYYDGDTNKFHITGSGIASPTLAENLIGAPKHLTIERSSGRVGIGGITNPSHILEINGVGRSTQSTWATTSDQRIKRNINAYTSGLAALLQVRPVSFRYNAQSGQADLDKQYVGILAQEIEQVLPGTVHTIDDSTGATGLSDLRLFDASELTFTLINAVKELKTENDSLKAQLEALMERVERLEKK